MRVWSDDESAVNPRASLSLRILCRLAVFLPGVFLRLARRRILRSHVPQIVRTGCADTRPQILVDVSIIARSDAGTGIQRVTAKIAAGMLLNPPAGFSVRLVQATRHRAYEYADAYANAISGGQSGPSSGDLLTLRAGDIFVGLDLTSRLLPSRMDDLLRMRAEGVTLAFVVYDHLPATYPRWFTRRATRDFSRWRTVLGLHADALFCISGTIAQETAAWLTRCLGHDRVAPQVADFHLGSDFIDGEDVPRQGAARDAGITLLAVGTVEPRKGHAQLLDAMEILWEAGADVRLVIAGRAGWGVDALADRLRNHHEVGQRLLWLSDIDDRELARQYRCANGLVMASKGEGFGLPLIEAAHHGVPILARDIPVFHEIAGDLARYFTATDATGLAMEIERWVAELRAGTAPDSGSIPRASWGQATACFAELVRVTALRNCGQG